MHWTAPVNSSLNSLCLNIYLKLICGGDPHRPPSAARSLGICPWLPQKGPNFCNFLMPKQRSGTAAQPRAHYRRGQQSYLERDPTWPPTWHTTWHTTWHSCEQNARKHASKHASMHASRSAQQNPPSLLPFRRGLDPWRCHGEVFNPSLWV